jgi:hypothetical protein
VKSEGTLGSNHEGKALAKPSSVVVPAAKPHGFVADAGCSMSMQALAVVKEGWRVVSRHRQWHQEAHMLSPPPVHRSVPADLVGRYFNYPCVDHVAVACMFPSRCLCYHNKGHQARSWKCPRSPDAVRPPLRHPRLTSKKKLQLTSMVVNNPRVGNVALPEPRGRCFRSHSSTLPSQNWIPTLEGTPSRYS